MKEKVFKYFCLLCFICFTGISTASLGYMHFKQKVFRPLNFFHIFCVADYSKTNMNIYSYLQSVFHNEKIATASQKEVQFFIITLSQQVE